jgi:orotidine-5'-phosphate decarboxylase
VADGAAGSGSAAEQAGRAVAAHCRALVEAAAPACVAVKVQLACFERLGAPGWSALAEVVETSRGAGLLVIADGKRGDVPHTAAAYAQSLFGGTPTPWGHVAGLGADAVTASPLLGRDALLPIVDAARVANAGVFVLVRTSNPGASDLQDADSGGAPWHERVARITHDLGAGGVGDSGLSDVGAVVAATAPGLVGRLRELMPHAIFLLPGIGAQGGRVEDLRAAFDPAPAAALVAASRSLVDPALAAGDARAAFDAAKALRDRAWALAS